MSGAGLAERLAAYGIPWNRTTVAKLESGRRENISVAELLALALALGTTPLALIADPRIGGPVPVADGLEVSPWTLALWARGDGHSEDRDPRLKVDRSTVVLFDSAASIADLCRQVLRPPAKGEDPESKDRSLLRLLINALDRVLALGAVPYPVPAAVCERAADLGFDLDKRVERGFEHREHTHRLAEEG